MPLRWRRGLVQGRRETRAGQPERRSGPAAAGGGDGRRWWEVATDMDGQAVAGWRAELVAIAGRKEQCVVGLTVGFMAAEMTNLPPAARACQCQCDPGDVSRMAWCAGTTQLSTAPKAQRCATAKSCCHVSLGFRSWSRARCFCFLFCCTLRLCVLNISCATHGNGFNRHESHVSGLGPR
jgi:hypothetical protein